MGTGDRAPARPATSPPTMRSRRPETLVVEEPLEIRVNGKPLTVTMRTPGSDIELAQGSCSPRASSGIATTC